MEKPPCRAHLEPSGRLDCSASARRTRSRTSDGGPPRRESPTSRAPRGNPRRRMSRTYCRRSVRCWSPSYSTPIISPATPCQGRRPARHPRRRPGPASAAGGSPARRAPAADSFLQRLAPRSTSSKTDSKAAQPRVPGWCRNGRIVADLSLVSSGEGHRAVRQRSEGVTAAQVEGCPRRRRHPPPSIHHLHLVGV